MKKPSSIYIYKNRCFFVVIREVDEEMTLDGEVVKTYTERFENKQEQFKDWFDNEKSDIKRTVGVSIHDLGVIIVG